jgi:DNA-directed RNA polymerase subunit beta'
MKCGLPKDMAAELYKPFIIRKLIERGIVKKQSNLQEDRWTGKICRLGYS